MYEQFFKLKAEPFRLSPDHRFSFAHQSYSKAKAYMEYAFERAEGFVMITGRPGTGKSTLVNDLVEALSGSNTLIAKLVSTQLEATDLLRMVAHEFGIDSETANKATLLQRLEKLLRSRRSGGQRSLLIIDEAQDLSRTALEELRLLTNLQLDSQPLLQVFLLGQEELGNMVRNPTMEQVHQRIIAACHLEALLEDETEEYIKHRLRQVGWQNHPAISKAAYPIISRFTGGIPRRINQICSRLFLHAAIEEKDRIGVEDLKLVISELGQEQLGSKDVNFQISFDVEDEFEELPIPDCGDSKEASVTPGPPSDLAEGQSQAEITPFSEPKANVAPSIEASAPVDAVAEAVPAMEQRMGGVKTPSLATLGLNEHFAPAAETDASITDHLIMPSRGTAVRSKLTRTEHKPPEHKRPGHRRTEQKVASVRSAAVEKRDETVEPPPSSTIDQPAPGERQEQRRRVEMEVYRPFPWVPVVVSIIVVVAVGAAVAVFM